jgi:hypothetical protein
VLPSNHQKQMKSKETSVHCLQVNRSPLTYREL